LVIASAAPFLAVLLWKSYGGSIYPPELGVVTMGHVLNAGLTIAVASLAACATEHPSTAAIVTLGVTVGTWILNFAAAIHGGLWERAAGFTPTAIVAEMQHGLVRLDVVLVALTLIVALVWLAGIWIRLGVPVRQRTRESLVVGGAALALAAACSFAQRAGTSPRTAAIPFRELTSKRCSRSPRRSAWWFSWRLRIRADPISTGA
jgi:hypothetical protein